MKVSCIAVAIFALAAGIGCQAPRGPVAIDSDDPDLQILAMKRDAAGGHRQDIPRIVQDLASDDPAIRFYAFETLHRLTGDDFGYHLYDDEDQRAPAMRRWQNWLSQQHITAK